MGHTVIAAENGLRALEAAQVEKPEVVLVDIGLPDMDGYQVARALRASSATRDLHVVALTGYATPEHRERALVAGFDHHLAKPIDADELQRVLR
jgi:CheY-like chemotaxis protein